MVISTLVALRHYFTHSQAREKSATDQVQIEVGVVGQDAGQLLQRLFFADQRQSPAGRTTRR